MKIDFVKTFQLDALFQDQQEAQYVNFGFIDNSKNSDVRAWCVRFNTATQKWEGKVVRGIGIRLADFDEDLLLDYGMPQDILKGLVGLAMLEVAKIATPFQSFTLN